MLENVWSCLETVTRQASHMERVHWIVLSVVVLLLGLACMRGFGSRDSF